MSILYQWKMVGRYADGSEIIVGGNDEEDCVYKLVNKEDEYGQLVWYSGYCDEDYVGGEYIGKENFIYE